jgi:hypothetical protein
MAMSRAETTVGSPAAHHGHVAPRRRRSVLARSRLALALGFCLAVAQTSLAREFAGYSVVDLRPGVNRFRLDGASGDAVVVLGHRENFNAHGFDVATFYVQRPRPRPSLDLVTFWDGDEESLELRLSGGADCRLHDFRVLRPKGGEFPVVVLADRELGDSYASAEIVTFRIYELRHNRDGEVGRPALWFERAATQTAVRKYCDVGEALEKELNIRDYRR